MEIEKAVEAIKEAIEHVHDSGSTPLADVITNCDQADMCLQDALKHLETATVIDEIIEYVNDAYGHLDKIPKGNISQVQNLAEEIGCCLDDVLSLLKSLRPQDEQPQE